MSYIVNPVIKGFSPDPSICAVGDDYYLVTSTFAYFPGVPIYHSRDLVNWIQIGNVLAREEQLNLEGLRLSQGIYAPTLRYHDGTFYMVTTNVTNGGNFVVTAEDPAGPWSDPYFIEDAPGIDPSLFFDDDGTCYFMGTRPNPKGIAYNGDWEIWLQEFDVDKMELVGLSTAIWKGALKEVIWPEAPHIYKKGGYYYLLIAEGGTADDHSITVARSEHINGPYMGSPKNPILTHRHLGKEFPVQNVGHGDLVETPNGEWFLTCLASRKVDGVSNLGRETFLARVMWEDDWPVVNPGAGKLLEKQPHSLPAHPVQPKENDPMSEPDFAYLYIRNPYRENYDTTSRDGWLRLHPTPVKLTDLDSPTYIGLRQPATDYSFTAKLEEHLQLEDEAGLVVLQSEQYAVRFVVTAKEDGKGLQVISSFGEEETVLGTHPLNRSAFELTLQGRGTKVKAIYRDSEDEVVVAENIDVRHLSTEIAGGFVGCTIGVYATSGNKTPGHLDVKGVELVDESAPIA